jgi:hypothetical protein
MPETYTLTITEAQAEVISRACELLARTMAGQWQEAYRLLPRDPMTNSAAVREVEDRIRELMPRVLRGGIDGLRSSLGMGHPGINPEHETAWDLYQVIRHRLGWEHAVRMGYVPSIEAERDWTTMMGVVFDPPIRYGPEPLAQIEKKVENPGQSGPGFV